MLQQLSQFFIYNVTLASYLYVYNNFRLVDLDPKNIYVWIVGFLIVDLGYYTFHRGAHEINLFWATHVVSKSDWDPVNESSKLNVPGTILGSSFLRIL
jgi:alkylglycerol monooxygenase